MEKQKMYAYMMAGAGFIMILANAINYVFGLGISSSVSTVIGLALVVTSMGMSRKDSKNLTSAGV